ncbi:MAG: NAD kinase [Flavobacteriaceae bacterium]|nr:NAD kinase [Flavobacteriaceae bacterium]
MIEFKKIAIYGYYKNSNTDLIIELVNLLRERGASIVIESGLHQNLKNSNINLDNLSTFSTYEDIDSSYSLFITLGGDGTILRATTFIRDKNIPILGINTGRLGFLATINNNELENALEKITKGEYSLQERCLLKLEIEDNETYNNDFLYALNEITISRQNTASMMSLDVYLDDEHLNKYWADGLIVSTPTGSTGYALSCNGPVISPRAKNLLLLPIAPHNLNIRPLIISDDVNIKVKASSREFGFLVSMDSRSITLNNDTVLSIRKASFTLSTILLNENSFIKTLRNKMLWGKDARNK